VAGGPLADAALWHLEVVDAVALSPTMRRVRVIGPGLEGLRYTPGQDLMLRVPSTHQRTDGGVVNRRYTIRSFDAAARVATLDASLHGAGPGTDWVRGAGAGDRIDAIGPRGKITPRLESDWHLFIGDETGMPGALAMIESLPPETTAQALLEVDGPADEQFPDLTLGPAVDLRWLHRSGGAEPGDDSLLLQAVGDLHLPKGTGHAYVAAEARVVRRVRESLVERGLDQDRISAKAYWRRGLANAEHGEPAR
jgi:NADPH-dependent ferric siderophore reductase